MKWAGSDAIRPHRRPAVGYNSRRAHPPPARGLPMPTRRSFLRSSAAAVAAPLVWSRTSAVAANDRLSLGFIGVGTMGSGHLGGFLGRKEIEVVAVCDVVKERLDNAS